MKVHRLICVSVDGVIADLLEWCVRDPTKKGSRLGNVEACSGNDNGASAGCAIFSNKVDEESIPAIEKVVVASYDNITEYDYLTDTVQEYLERDLARITRPKFILSISFCSSIDDLAFMTRR